MRPRVSSASAKKGQPAEGAAGGRESFPLSLTCSKPSPLRPPPASRSTPLLLPSQPAQTTPVRTPQEARFPHTPRTAAPCAPPGWVGQAPWAGGCQWRRLSGEDALCGCGPPGLGLTCSDGSHSFQGRRPGLAHPSERTRPWGRPLGPQLNPEGLGVLLLKVWDRHRPRAG